MRGAIIVIALLCLPTHASAQSTCTGYIEPCVAKAVTAGTDAKSYRPKCVAAASACKKTGCFIGPTSGVTFACNLGKS